jgi:hypothetical protein
MARPPKKSAKSKAPKPVEDAMGEGNSPAQAVTAVAEPPPPPAPSIPVADLPEEAPVPPPPKREQPAKPGRDRTGQLIKIAQLQAMSMQQLTSMAKEMSIDNFGTMRKQELIYQILQENAKQSGILFAEGVLEILPEGYGFLRSQSFSYLPVPRTSMCPPRRSAGSISRPAT